MIETQRLILRQWRMADREPFAALNADPQVMEHFPAPKSREESDASVDAQIALIAEHGTGFFALERRSDGAFLGFTGVKASPAGLPFAGTPEVGWRLARHAWGRGYASEAARAALAHVFARGEPRVFSFTPTTNLRSQAVMRRLGMAREPGRDFDHPEVPDGHRLRRHVVFSIACEAFAADPA